MRAGRLTPTGWKERLAMHWDQLFDFARPCFRCFSADTPARHSPCTGRFAYGPHGQCRICTTCCRKKLVVVFTRRTGSA
jgi:hypothetical protein